MSPALAAVPATTAPELREVEVAKMKVDPTYQRAPSQGRINKMARGWDTRLCEPLVVSFRDGFYFVVIGQHRMLAARKAQIKTLPCLILYDQTQSDEAQLFELNATLTKRISWVERHRALLTSGNPLALEVDRIVREHGHVGFDGSLRAIGATYSLAKDGLLDFVLGVPSKAWRNLDGTWLDSANDAQVLRALAEFVRRYPEVPQSELVKACARHHPRELRLANLGGQAAGTESWRIVRGWYNRGRTVNRLIGPAA